MANTLGAGFGLDPTQTRQALGQLLALLQGLPPALLGKKISPSDALDENGQFFFPRHQNLTVPVFDDATGVIVWPANSYASFKPVWISAMKLLGTPDLQIKPGVRYPLEAKVSEAITAVQTAITTFDMQRLRPPPVIQAGLPSAPSGATSKWPWILGGAALLLGVGGYAVWRARRA